MPKAKPVNHSKREQAYYQLRQLLILQQLPEGERLREAEWTDRLNVNRSALREAFVRIEGEGLIESGPKTGFFVPHLTLEAIQEVLVVRKALESAAIEIVCEKGLNSPRRLKPMKEACDLFERLIRDGYNLSIVEADRRFHALIVEISSNQRLLIAYRHAPLPIIQPDIINAEQWGRRMREVLAEHHAILAALRAGEASRAKQLLTHHLENDHRNLSARTKAGRPARLGLMES